MKKKNNSGPGKEERGMIAVSFFLTLAVSKTLLIGSE
jgi:hypothetical protein